MCNLDIGSHGPQVSAVTGLGDVPYLRLAVRCIIANSWPSRERHSVEGDTRDVTVARGGIVAADTDHQAIGVGIGRVLPGIRRVDVDVIPRTGRVTNGDGH